MAVCCLCRPQRVDRIHQHDRLKLARGRGHDGGGRILHGERCAGCDSTQDGKLTGNVPPTKGILNCVNSF